jgi:hypothetical protein
VNVLWALVQAIKARTAAAEQQAEATRWLARTIDAYADSLPDLARAADRIADALEIIAPPIPATAKWDVGTRETESHGE